MYFTIGRQRFNKSGLLSRLQRPAADSEAVALPPHSAHSSRPGRSLSVFSSASSLSSNPPPLAPPALEPTLMVFVPVWREADSQLRRTIMSLRNGYYDKNRLSVCVVIDECEPAVAHNCLSILFGFVTSVLSPPVFG